MTNLEAYFRTWGIKIAQERFDKPKLIEPVPMMLNKRVQDYINNIKLQVQQMNDILNYSLWPNKPKPMTELEIIDKRLSLFPEYLKYYFDDLYKTPFVLDIDSMPIMDARDLMRTFNEQGYLMVSAQIEAPLNFDGWLLHNGHPELSDLKPAPMKLSAYEPYKGEDDVFRIGFDPYYDAEKGSFVRDEDEAVVWRKDPNGRWRMIK